MDEVGKYLEEFILVGKWNESQLSLFFQKQLVDVIKFVNIQFELQQDQLELLSKFSGKSIYALASKKMNEDFGEDKYWNWIKKSK